MCGNRRIRLQRRMNDPSLIRVHRLKRYGPPASLYLACDILSKILKRLFPSSAVILRIKLHSYISVLHLIGYSVGQILQRIQCLSALADHDAQIAAFHINREGAQAVAALAYGTETIRPVAKVTGPGNAFVAAAKKLVSGDVGIDMIAGPSEVCVVADETADPSMVAIDLMAQAEHDPLAACYLVTFSDAYADAVEAAIADHMERTTRADITRASLDDHGLIVVCPTMEQALEAVNVIAPEHLEMHVANAMEYLGAIRNAGAIFLGEWTPEAVGDYVAGPNHTLPTGGTARYSSPLSVDDFVKKSSVIQYTAAALKNDARSVVQIATHEGLWAHAQSVALRLQSLLAAEQASVAGGSAAAGVDAGAGATTTGVADE